MTLAFDPCAIQYIHLYDCLKKNARADNETISNVIGIFNQLQLPVPSWHDEYISATKGLITMTNRYGVVIRIEDAAAERVVNPWVVQPIGSFDAGRAIVEIVPAARNLDDERLSQKVTTELGKSGIEFFDNGGSSNMGMLPVKSAVYPKGIPVVIDRLAVRRADNRFYVLKDVFNDMGAREDPQAVYAPLSAALKAAWPDQVKEADASKMAVFWQMCESFVKDGKLIAGWNQDRSDAHKLIEARNSASYYDQLIAEFSSPSR